MPIIRRLRIMPALLAAILSGCASLTVVDTQRLTAARLDAPGSDSISTSLGSLKNGQPIVPEPYQPSSSLQ